jgi:site-specific DNA-methyltransferase (adenine-specific)
MQRLHPWPVDQLLQGEALAELRELPDKCADAVVTDPPYSSGGQFRGDRAGAAPSVKYVRSDVRTIRPDFGGDNRDQRSYAYWGALWLSECLRIARPGAPIVLFTDWRQLPASTDALQAGGWIWRGLAVWDKTEAARPMYGRFRNQCEYLLWGSNGPMAIGGDALPGVYRIPVRQADKHHTTGKPTELLRQLLRIVPAGGVVLDPFAGSGTTAVAAATTGRHFIAIEQEPAYVQIARRRLAELEPAAA